MFLSSANRMQETQDAKESFKRLRMEKSLLHRAPIHFKELKFNTRSVFRVVCRTKELFLGMLDRCTRTRSFLLEFSPTGARRQ
jgi:hypothetical protein